MDTTPFSDIYRVEAACTSECNAEFLATIPDNVLDFAAVSASYFFVGTQTGLWAISMYLDYMHYAG